MERWPFERSWHVFRGDDQRETCRTMGLREFHSCVLLGAAGMGKTFEMQNLAAEDRRQGLDVRFERLAALGPTADGLHSSLNRLSQCATGSTVFYLDALDEVMVPVRTTGLIVSRWIRETLSVARPTLRISCRSAVWPAEIDTAIRDVYGADAHCNAVLRPLSEEEIRAVATKWGADPDNFIAEVELTAASLLAQQPLTLLMLLRMFVAHGGLPNRRSELYATGVRTLASERAERRDAGTAPEISVDELLEAAERLACFMILSGRDHVDLGDEPGGSCLGVLELESLPGNGRRLDTDCLRAIRQSGLCEGIGDHRFRFIHRQLAEYLAGRRLARLLPHQARSMLASGLGWQSGVAGPLRETASFAATESSEIAAWVTDHDPEVVGLSDIADNSLRRRATLNLVERFRRHELTDSQILRDNIVLEGFQYQDAERDISPLLREREKSAEGVLECAIKLIETWKLESMSDDLATLVLDASAPARARVSAGYTLAKIGTPAARSRLLPLVNETGGSPDEDLKGLALRCNWPDSLSVPDLLDALTPPLRNIYHGAYLSFLYTLDEERFDASGHLEQGLKWARRFVQRGGDHKPIVRIVKRIAISALDHIDEPGIADGLARLLVATAKAHGSSPLVPARVYGNNEQSPPPALVGRSHVRRKLIDSVAAIAPEDTQLWWIGHETPSFLVVEDFPWLLIRATDETLSMTQRNHYAELALMLPWVGNLECVEAWATLRTIEPVASAFKMPLSMELESQAAKQARINHAKLKRLDRPRVQKKLPPPLRERVSTIISKCESDGPQYFIHLCREMTLDNDRTEYIFSRFIKRSPGWTAASDEERDRIVSIAKALLESDHDEKDLARTLPLSQLLIGHITAFWLVMDEDPTWIENLPTEWWRKWTWYFLRELHPNTHRESCSDKQPLLMMLRAKAPTDVRNELRRLAVSSDTETKSLLSSLLEVFSDVVDPDLDELLCGAFEVGAIHEDRAGDVARFVLSRNGGRAMTTCVSLLDSAALGKTDAVATRAAVALLQVRSTESWERVHEFLNRRPDLAARVLGEYAHSSFYHTQRDEREQGLDHLGVRQVGQLYWLFLEHFPHDTDPVHDDTAHSVGPGDAARYMRDRLIEWLGGQASFDAVNTLREIELRFGAKYPWLRRPRSRAERAYRMSIWTPVYPHEAAQVLASSESRLIRNSNDAIEGVMAAIERFARKLRSSSPSEVDDLWNRPRNLPATPKEEERFSDKICVAIRDYFREFAVVANREVQIARRTAPSSDGGAPGSEVDVLTIVPSTGTSGEDTIVIPVEVKLSTNREAKTGLQDQLVDRYMSELRTNVGVYVLIWVGTNRTARYRSLWTSIDKATAEIPLLAKTAASARTNSDIRTAVVDATLPRARVAVIRKKAKSKKKSQGRTRTNPGTKKRTSVSGHKSIASTKRLSARRRTDKNRSRN
ncbi:MAG: NACHT domain-containing NTPase [Phycisphaerales bacterium]